MKRYLLFILFLFTTLIAKEQKAFNPLSTTLIDLEGEPTALVAGCVNAVSGSFIQSEVDVALNLAHPLILGRVNADCIGSNPLGKGWSYNHLGRAEIILKPIPNRRHHSMVSALLKDSGSHLVFDYPYPVQYKDVAKMKIHKDAFKKGMTNTGSGHICAGTNLKNHDFTFDSKSATGTLVDGLGTVQKFTSFDKYSTYFYKTHETLPNGNQLVYEYDKKLSVPTKIRSLGRDGSEMGSIIFKYPKDKEFDKHKTLEHFTSDGRKITYRYKKLKQKKALKEHVYITEVIRPNAPQINYEYSQGSQTEDYYISKKVQPEGRYLLIGYYRHGRNGINFADCGKHDLRLNRVKFLKGPIGPDGKVGFTHRFFYDLKKKDGILQEGKTTVFDALNQKTEYFFGKDERLSAISRFHGEKKVSREVFFWGKENTPNHCNLISRHFENEVGKKLYSKAYVYDDRGNILEEWLYGNLTGKFAGENHVQANGYLKWGSEACPKRFTYSKCSKNLKLTESDPRKTVRFGYLPGTCLVTSQITLAEGQVKLRQFTNYDGKGAVIEEIMDDGNTEDKNNLSGVSQRHVKQMKTNAQGLPIEVVQTCLDIQTGTYLLLGKVINHYSKEGMLIKQDTYDSQNQYAYSNSWEYDRSGNCIKEVNALGECTLRQFDIYGNKLFEQGPDTRFYMTYTYDRFNRLTSDMRCESNNTFKNTYTYDLVGRKISATDRFGQTTRYVYDGLGRLIQEMSPQVKDELGNLYHPTKTFAYDAFGNPTLIKDSSGLAVQKKFTTRGSPYFIIHPDGLTEEMEYEVDGPLKTHLSKDGLLSVLTNDFLGRAIKKEIFSETGELLKVSSATYSAFQLLSEIDVEGNETVYSYDAAGRLEKIQMGDKTTRFFYDSLGRLIKEQDSLGTIQAKEYDLLNRMIEERKEDSFGNIIEKATYGYDSAGNRTSTSLWEKEGIATSTILFDTEGREIKIVDAKGYVTTIDYCKSLPIIVTKDPLGNVTESHLDASGKQVLALKLNGSGKEVQRQALFYNKMGLLSRQVNVAETKEVTTLFLYDTSGRLAKRVEAFGMAEERQTEFIYNALGQRHLLIRPDGTQLIHSYDALGRLISLKDSQDTLDISYTYDIADRLIGIEDHLLNQTTRCTFDRYGNLLEETLGNGLNICYEYDLADQLLVCTLPDESKIAYTYVGSQLKTIDRQSKTGEVCYAHEYEEYDLNGKVLKAKLIGNAGELHHSYDLLGRLTQIDTDQWKQKETHFDPAGNMIARTIEDAYGVTPCTFSYEDLYQLEEETGICSHSYQSDALFARTSKDGKNHVLNALSELLEDESCAYTYDACGQLKETSLGKRFSYDSQGRLVTVTDGDTQTSYIYDACNRRLSKTLSVWNGSAYFPEKTVRYLYSGQNEIGAVDEEGNITELRLLGIGLGAEIGASVALELDGEVFAPVHDSSGNIVCLIDAITGEVRETIRYSAFGEETDTPSLSPWRFTSKRLDQETGWIYFGRRYYDPAQGRWTTPDPLEENFFPNLYAYVNNSPLTHIDLYGLYTEIDSKTGLEIRTELGRNGEYYPYCDYEEYSKSKSSISHVGFRVDPNLSLLYVNGIQNTKKDAELSARYISDLTKEIDPNGYKINYIHNASHGMEGDLHECQLGYRGICTNPVKLIHKALDQQFEAYPNSTCLIIGHSQGLLHIKNAFLIYNKDRLDKIFVLAVAPAAYIPKGLCAGIKHIRSESDYIPYADSEGQERAKGTIITLPADKKASSFDHTFQSPTYYKELKECINNFIKNKGKSF